MKKYPHEIRAAIEVYVELGTVSVHMHVRDEQGRPSCSLEKFPAFRFPPTTRPMTQRAQQVNQQWDTYGIQPTQKFIGRPEGMMKHWWNPEEIEKAMNLKVMP